MQWEFSSFDHILVWEWWTLFRLRSEVVPIFALLAHTKRKISKNKKRPREQWARGSHVQVTMSTRRHEIGQATKQLFWEVVDFPFAKVLEKLQISMI